MGSRSINQHNSTFPRHSCLPTSPGLKDIWDFSFMGGTSQKYHPDSTKVLLKQPWVLKHLTAFGFNSSRAKGGSRILKAWFSQARERSGRNISVTAEVTGVCGALHWWSQCPPQRRKMRVSKNPDLLQKIINKYLLSSRRCPAVMHRSTSSQKIAGWWLRGWLSTHLLPGDDSTLTTMT